MIFILAFFMLLSAKEIQNDGVIIDSDISFEQAIAGTKAPKEIIEQLCIINVDYYSLDNKLHRGQLVINKKVKTDIIDIFRIMRELKFPVNKVIPIVKYDWNDDASMLDNNTSSFCYRTIAGTNRPSKHAQGFAIDINPFFNPVEHKDGTMNPRGAKHNPKVAGTFTAEHPIVKEFKSRGWRWGGEFSSYKDNHHFDIDR
jgi:hypothetical protein